MSSLSLNRSNLIVFESLWVTYLSTNVVSSPMFLYDIFIDYSGWRILLIVSSLRDIILNDILQPFIHIDWVHMPVAPIFWIRRCKPCLSNWVPRLAVQVPIFAISGESINDTWLAFGPFPCGYSKCYALCNRRNEVDYQYTETSTSNTNRNFSTSHLSPLSHYAFRTTNDFNALEWSLRKLCRVDIASLAVILTVIDVEAAGRAIASRLKRIGVGRSVRRVALCTKSRLFWQLMWSLYCSRNY